MITKGSRQIYAAVILYFIIAIFFLFLHIFRSEDFSGVRGNIRFMGVSTKSTLLTPSQVRRIRIQYNGLEFFLNPTRRLKVVTSDGIVHPLRFESYEALEQGLLLHFSNEVDLRFISDTHSKKVTLRPELPLTIPPMDRLILPVRWQKGFSLVEEEELFQLIRGEDEGYYITAPVNTRLFEEGKYLDIDVSNSVLRELVLEETLTGTGRTLEDWYEKEGNAELQSAYLRVVKDFMDQAFLSLRNRMANNGEITDPNGERYFSETALNAIMIEAIGQGQYPGLQAELGDHANRNRARLSYRSTTFLGDVVHQGSALISSDWRLVTQIKEGLGQDNYPFFQYEDLYPFVKTQIGLHREMDSLLSQARQNQGDVTDYLYQLERMEFLLAYHRENSDPELLQYIVGQLQEIFLSNVLWIREDLLLFDQQGVARMEASLRLGNLLYSNGDMLNQEIWPAAGQKIVMSVLKYMDDQAYLPEELIFDSSGEAETQGEFLPEVAYEILCTSTYKPRREDLTDQLGIGSWAYTGAEKFSLVSTPRETVINVDFPVGAAHHMVIRGVKPFYNIYLHGIRWKSDLNFQRYSDGWLYDGERNILYMKIQHRIPTETVEILYYDREAENNPSPAEEPSPDEPAEP